MTEEMMLAELERGRKISENGHTVWAMGDGESICLTTNRNNVGGYEKLGFWVISIFEHGHRVEA